MLCCQSSLYQGARTETLLPFMTFCCIQGSAYPHGRQHLCLSWVLLCLFLAASPGLAKPGGGPQVECWSPIGAPAESSSMAAVASRGLQQRADREAGHVSLYSPP